nr:P-loop NTPase fold protein [uncultured Pseudomonas sp.]
MSVAKVKKALRDFAMEGKGSAIVLKGDWGTGKTHLWETVVREDGENFHYKKYCYVSLFGVGSLKDLKRSIFENTVPSAGATSKNSVIENLKRINFSDGSIWGWARRLFRPTAEVKIPYVGSISGIIDSVQYSLTSRTLICIDDFERRGNSLSSRDVLGLISNLIDKKDCSVVLVLNDGSLPKDDEFFSYSEKIFDYGVVFSPAVEEAGGWVFGEADEFVRMVADNSVKLNINNIRLLRKIKYFSQIIGGRLGDCKGGIQRQAAKTLPLAVLSMYGGKSSKVDIDFLQSYEGSLTGYLPYADEPSDAEREALAELDSKVGYLEVYGFNNCDEFDKAIIDLVRKGYADEDAIDLLVKKLDDQIKITEDLSLLYKAWDVYRSSFDVNDQEVFSAFDAVLSTTIQRLNLFQLGEITTLYESLGKSDQVHAAVDEYFSTVMLRSDLRSEDDHFQRPSNDYVQEKLNDYFQSLIVVRPLQDVVLEAISGAGLRSQDLALELGGKSQLEFLDFLKSYKGSDLNDILKMCLDCGTSQYPEVEVRKAHHCIFLNVYNSLVVVSASSPVNNSRAGHHISRYRKVYESLLKQAREAESPTA